MPIDLSTSVPNNKKQWDYLKKWGKSPVNKVETKPKPRRPRRRTYGK